MLRLALCSCVVRDETLDAALCFFIASSVNANTQQDLSVWSSVWLPQTHTHTPAERSVPLLPDKTATTTLIYPELHAFSQICIQTLNAIKTTYTLAGMHTRTHTIVHCLPTAGSQLR